MADIIALNYIWLLIGWITAFHFDPIPIDLNKPSSNHIVFLFHSLYLKYHTFGSCLTNLWRFILNFYVCFLFYKKKICLLFLTSISWKILNKLLANTLESWQINSYKDVNKLWFWLVVYGYFSSTCVKSWHAMCFRSLIWENKILSSMFNIWLSFR